MSGPRAEPALRFLFVNRHREDVVGGSEVQCDLLARALVARGNEVVYAVSEPRRTAYSSPYPCVRLDAPVPSAFARVLREHRPDVVYWRRNKPHLRRCVHAAHRAGAAFVFASSHDNDTRGWPPGAPAGRGLGGAARWLRRLVWRVEGAVDALGHRHVDGHVLQHRGQAGGLVGPRARLIRSSVFTDTVAFRHERPFVAWVANLKPRKRPEAFVELARLLADEPVDFLAVGALQDERYRVLEDPAATPEGFHYLGFRSPEEVNGIIAASELLVVTCEPEGFPNVFMQAWHLGKAVVTLDYDPEGMIRGHGLGSSEPDVTALAARVRGLLRDAGERAAIGARARLFARETFDVTRNAAELEAFCREVVEARRH